MGRHIYTHKTINGVKKRLHRHLMEESLGRELDTNEHVYHVNGNPYDNRLENLIVITKNSKVPSRDKESDQEKDPYAI